MFFDKKFNMNSTFSKKLGYYFIDYDMIPLYFHENYLSSFN